MKTIAGREPGNLQPCAGGCGTMRELPVGQSSYWCEPCVDRESAWARAEMGLLPAAVAPSDTAGAHPPLPRTAAAAVRAGSTPVGEAELDADLAKTVKRTAVMRQGFYVVVLLVALAGQVSGAVEALGIPLVGAIPAVAALELGGIVVLANADVRRRLGERATASRVLSAAIAAGAVAFNWLAHANHLLGGFFAGMSALGYLVWLMHTENQRRDRLRAKGALPPTTPAYEPVGHWLRHPWLTRRARSLAKVNPDLGLYKSIAAARTQVRAERRQAAIAKVLHRKIRAAVDPTTADIAVAVYDLDQIAARLAAGADYDGLTELLAVDLTPTRIAAGAASRGRRTGRRAVEAPDRGQLEPAGARRALEPARPTHRPASTQPPGESGAGGSGSAAPAHGTPRAGAAPASRRSMLVPDRLPVAYAELTRSLGREPSGAELAERAGVSKATANRFKQAAHRRTGGET